MLSNQVHKTCFSSLGEDMIHWDLLDTKSLTVHVGEIFHIPKNTKIAMQIIISIQKSDLYHGKKIHATACFKIKKTKTKQNSLHFKDAIIEIACLIYKLTMTEQ